MTAFDNLDPFVLDGILISMSWKTIAQELLDSSAANVQGIWLNQTNESRADIANGWSVKDSQNLAC